MIAAGHQPNYLPYIGFFHKAARCDKFIIVDTVQFVKRGPFGWINRNRIRTATGWIWLTVPVITKGKYFQSIKDTVIDNSTDWRRKHWMSILRNYQSAPYFALYSEFFSQLYQKEWQYLSALNEAIIRYVCEQMHIKADIVKSSELIVRLPVPLKGRSSGALKLQPTIPGSPSAVSPAEAGLQPRIPGSNSLPLKLPEYNSLHSNCQSKVEGKATDLIINMCKSVNADTYLHGKHGRDYVDEDKMNQHNIKSIYQQFDHPVYQQRYQPFIPEMAIIDLLFNCGPDSERTIKG
ncbi:MAG: WbqC family protein [Planctomycetota bacterium]